MTTITSTAPTTITANNWPNIIDGRDIVGGGEEVLRDSPAHDIRVASYHNATEAEVDAAVTAAHKAFSTGDWPRTSGAERAALLRRVAARIEAERDELALIETLESGKPISQAKDEVASAAGIWYYAASLAQHAYGDAHNHLGPNYLAVTVKEPVGVVGVITPWNFPLLIVSQKLPFALAVGCTAVIKPSDLTPGTTTRLVQILHDEWVPEWRCQPRSWRWRCRWLAVESSRHPHDHLYRIHRRRPHGRPGGRQGPEEGEPRTGRQEPASDLPGC